MHPFDIDRTYGSHTPILSALLRLYPPRVVIEAGAGNYSTPLIADCQTQDVGNFEWHIIEHDPIWAERCAPLAPRAHWHTLPLPFELPATRAQFDAQALAANYLDEKYRHFAEEIAPGAHTLTLLFVDTLAAARLPALMHLAPLNGFVVIHDTEYDNPRAVYGLGAAAQILAAHRRYSYRPHGGTPEGLAYPWTDILATRPIHTRRLELTAWPDALALWGRPAPLLHFPSPGVYEWQT